RSQIVPTTFRTSSTTPRIVATITTTAAAMHTARMSFSMAVWSGRLVRSRLQEQALRSNGRGAPEHSTTPRCVLHEDESARTVFERPRVSQPDVGRALQRQVQDNR